MKVAVIGANGQLGQDVVRAFADQGDEVDALTHQDIELSSLESVLACLRAAQADAVVNTAAMHNVESCEQQPWQGTRSERRRRAQSRICNARPGIGTDPRQHGLRIRRQKGQTLRRKRRSTSAECLRQDEVGGRAVCAGHQSQALRSPHCGSLRHPSLPCQGRAEFCRPHAPARAGTRSRPRSRLRVH